MKKLISCGIIVKYRDQYLLGHVTGRKNFDIFKGRMESGETYVQTAIRECCEESGLSFEEDDLKFLGYHVYIPKKDLVLYITRIAELDESLLRCSTFIDDIKPETDYYKLFTFDEMINSVARNMGRVLNSLRIEIDGY